MFKEIDIDLVELSPFHKGRLPPVVFEEVEAIRETQIVRPISVRQVGNVYQILRGAVSWRAAQVAGVYKVPIDIADGIDDHAAALLVKADIRYFSESDPMQTAQMLFDLVHHEKMSKAEAGRKLGMSRSAVVHLLRLRDHLHPDVKTMLSRDNITLGQAKYIVTLPEKDQVEVACNIERHKLTVKETRNLVESRKQGRPQSSKKQDQTSSIEIHLRSITNYLQEQTCSNLEISENGTIKIPFYDNAEILEGILESLGFNLSQEGQGSEALLMNIRDLVGPEGATVQYDAGQNHLMISDSRWAFLNSILTKLGWNIL